MVSPYRRRVLDVPRLHCHRSVQAEEGHKSSAMPAFGIEGVDEQEMKCNKPDTAAV
jgi:hypothetical protein